MDGRLAVTQPALRSGDFSAFLETGKINILFDSGHSENWKNNAKNIGVDVDTADFIVLSHHHWDHTKGLLYHEFNNKKKLIMHPDVLEKVPKEDSELHRRDFEIITSRESLEFSPGILFLGEIPRTTVFETGAHKGDPMLDDSAIAVKTEDGLFVLTGCSHAGVVNICEHAKQVTGQSIKTVAGGFHLFEDEPIAVGGALDYFKTEKVDNIYPMHCIDPPTFSKFYSEIGAVKFGVGDIFEV
jgi:7,8-dihydropterin-6-yl-methyl-4-(beta-D-ribofuranosyl)aminobenzene 5'-phosphate synthase